MKKFLLLFILIQPYLVFAQNLDDFKKKSKNEFEKFKKENNNGLESFSKKFEDFKKKNNEDFVIFLADSWKEFNVFSEIEVPEKPKPNTIPKYTSEDSTSSIELIPLLKKDTSKTDMIKIDVLPSSMIAPIDKSAITFSLSFYGFDVKIGIASTIKKIKLESTDEISISKFWKNLSFEEYEPIVQQLQSYRSIMNLNDWGYYQLVQRFSNKLFIEKNEQKCFTWFIMNQSGFNVKIGTCDDKITLLIPTKNIVYGEQFIKINNQFFYLFGSDAKSLKTYEVDYIKTNKKIDLKIERPMLLGDNYMTRNLSFNYHEENIKIDIIYNKNIIDFYENYPLTKIENYFTTPVSAKTKESLLFKLKPIIDSKSQREGLDFLLSFVQNAFAYKTDRDQFNREKFFFAEELFYYPFCDCEDRSVLFSWLVQNLLNLKVVGLNYPNHVATAVNIDTEGDFLMFEGKKYVMADPTFINAPIGATMASVKKQHPSIIKIDQNRSIKASEEKIWDSLISKGIRKADNQNNIIKISDDFYAVGYRNDYKTEVELKIPTLIKTNLQGDVIWEKNGKSSSNSTVLNITSDFQNNIYISGEFDNYLTWDDQTINSSNNSDIFVANYSIEGVCKWLHACNISSEYYGNSINYIYVSSKDGNSKDTKYFYENYENNYGLSLLGENLYLLGGFNHKTLTKHIDINVSSSDTYNITNEILNKQNELIENNYEKSISGIFAILDLIKYNGIIVKGEQIQNTINKVNPSFRNKCSKLYESLSRLSFIKNSDGIVNVLNNNQKDIQIFLMKIENNAKLKIVELPDGNKKIEVLSGIKVGKAFLWFTVNSIKLFKYNGNLLFDYDSDHTQKLVNLKRDILM